MPKFMLLLFDNPSDYAGFTPDQMQQVVKDYGAWAQEMGKAGKLVSGDKLADEGGKVITQAGVTDGPFAESKEVLGGYFIVNAESYGEAVELARNSPHVKYGASTHVRQIDDC